MKKILFHLMSSVMTFAFLCMFAQGAWAEFGHMRYERADNTTENFDSVSYAYGDIITRYFVELPDSIIHPFEFNKESLAEIIRGFEENFAYMKYSQDTIKNISFELGAMQGVFLFDYTQSQRDSIPYDCILAGVNKVVNHELTLPQDTIKINVYIKSLPQDMNPVDMPDDEKCNFFTYYGIMKALAPGLQQYIFEQTGKHEDEIPADYEAFAAGFAMMAKGMLLGVKAESGVELSPYDYGVSMSTYILMQPLPFHLSEADFFDGCRAAAGLDKRKMTIEESDRIISNIVPEREEPTIIQENQTE